DAYTFPVLPEAPLSFQASAYSLSTLCCLMIPHNNYEAWRVLEKKLELMKFLEKNVEGVGEKIGVDEVPGEKRGGCWRKNDYTFDQMVEWAEQEHFEDEEINVSCLKTDLSSVLIPNNGSMEEPKIDLSYLHQMQKRKNMY
ncbi:hypothetical protein Tco_1129240, partial [Tanacetum coccineum]